MKIFKNALKSIAEIIIKKGLKKVGFESGVMSVAEHKRLKKLLPGVTLKAAGGTVEESRVIKEPSEIKSIRRAIAVADKGFKDIEDNGVRGRSEADVAWSIERAVREHGADGLSFDMIVASGARSALPHSSVSKNKIKQGSFIVVDMGVELDGYMSDETRTYVAGRATGRHKEIYAVVKDAHDKAISVVRPGIGAEAVDKAARDHIKKSGYGKYFAHGTGHGVGMDVHERPHVSPGSKDVLTDGMVITVEPGIYIPGFGGVRIEDMVLVTPGGHEVLTDGVQELRVLG